MNHLQTSELCATAQLSILDTELHSKQELRAEVSMPTCFPHHCFAELFLPHESPLLSLRHVAAEKICSVSKRVCFVSHPVFLFDSCCHLPEPRLSGGRLPGAWGTSCDCWAKDSFKGLLAPRREGTKIYLAPTVFTVWSAFPIVMVNIQNNLKGALLYRPEIPATQKTEVGGSEAQGQPE